MAQASERVNALKKQLKEISALKQHAAHVARTHKEIGRLQEEIANLESELSSTGSSKTADDVQIELDTLATEMWVLFVRSECTSFICAYRRSNNREQSNLLADKERHINSQRTLESEIMKMQMKENTLSNEIRDKDNLEANIAQMKQDIQTLTARLRVRLTLNNIITTVEGV